MGKTTIKHGQTWWDVGVEIAGAWEAGIDLSLAQGLSMTEPPPHIPITTQQTYNKPMERYCHTEGVSPATLNDDTGIHWQIFAPTFSTIFR